MFIQTILADLSPPNSLSIWTKHIRGIALNDAFMPHGCDHCQATQAVTLGSGQDRGEIHKAVHDRNLSIVGGTGDTIGLGGYITGGGHSPLSANFGLAADQVLEMEVVTAAGHILVVNKVQNPNLFRAMRGVSNRLWLLNRSMADHVVRVEAQPWES